MIIELSPVEFSRMAGRGRGRGRGANDPPPPEYMAGLVQQLELSRQVMQGVLAQF